MIKTYLKMAFRNIRKNGVFSFINILGLGIGLAACLVLLTWVIHEMSYDKFHDNADRLYKIITKNIYPNGDVTHFGQTPYPLPEELRVKYPEVENATIYWRRPWQLKYKEKSFVETGVLTEPNFFEMFSFPLVKGDYQKAMKNLKGVLISESLAEKLFGDEDPMGKSIVEGFYGVGDLTVEGVFKDIPENSHIQFEFIAPFKLSHGGYGNQFKPWGLSDFETYVLLKKGVSQQAFDAKIKMIIKNYMPEEVEELYSLNIRDIYLNDDIWSPKQGSRSNVYVFSITAFLILLIACFNYVNLSVARGSERMNEVGVRKVNGATRRMLSIQFFTESFIFTGFALLLGVFLTYLAMPEFAALTGASINFSPLEVNTLIVLLSVFLVTSLLAGLYPALYLSSFKPVSILKNKLLRTPGQFGFRKLLVIFQFSISILLIIGLLVIKDQLHFIYNKDLGFDKRNLVCFDLTPAIGRNWKTIKTELLKHPEIRETTFSNTTPGYNESSTNTWSWEGHSESSGVSLNIVGAFDGMLETFGLKMEKGRFFSDEFPGDYKNGFVINEEAANIMGFEDPIGKTMKVGNAEREGKVIGVVKNYHYNTLNEKIGPMVFVYRFGLDTMFIKLNTGDTQRGLAIVKETIGEIVPGEEISYSFVDDKINALYVDEANLEELIEFFALLAVFVSSLGLYGLALFTASRRRKEIGIRKVNGAGNGDIIFLLVRDSVKWVVTANIIAWPLAYYFLSNWISGFAYRTNLGLINFLWAAVIALMVAVVTVSYHALKAARSNPVKSLRYE